MAKGKRSSGKTYVSKGIVGTTKNKNTDPAKRLSYQLKAWLAGKNVVLTIANPDKNNTKERFIKVNARDHWGNPKRK